MDQSELEGLATALLSRMAGHARQPQGGIGQGSGVPAPGDLYNKDPEKARAARKKYCEALSDVGLERCSPAERAIYMEECKQTLRDDGYYAD